jgi:hypothetical protein
MSTISNNLYKALKYKTIAIVNYDNRNITIAILARGTYKRNKVVLVHVYLDNEPKEGHIEYSKCNLEVLIENKFLSVLLSSKLYTHNITLDTLNRAINVTEI